MSDILTGLTGRHPEDTRRRFSVSSYMDRVVLSQLIENYIPKNRKEILSSIMFYFDMDGTVNYWDEGGNIYEPHYFLNRRPIWNMIDAIALLKAYGCHCYFGSAVMKELQDAEADKRQYIKNIGLSNIDLISIPYGKNKDDYLPGERKVLIDDHTPNLLKFSGIGIKFLNNVNHKRGRWQGPTINMQDEPLVLALKMVDYACRPYEKNEKRA